MKTKNELPDKPSELIKVALEDLKKVERSKKYEVNMGDWHEPNGVCSVCFAGAVMVKTLDCNYKKSFESHDFKRNIYIKLEALDGFRRGWIRMALADMHISPNRYPGLINNVSVVNYKDSPLQFKRDMRGIVMMLEKAGL